MRLMTVPSSVSTTSALLSFRGSQNGADLSHDHRRWGFILRESSLGLNMVMGYKTINDAFRRRGQKRQKKKESY